MNRCFIFGAAPISGLPVMPNNGDFLIAADGGLMHINRLGLNADLILGDFDSLESAPHGENVITLPSEKADTDMALAVNEGIARGYKSFIIYGGTGGERIDHTLANIQVAARCAEAGIDCFLIGEGSVITAIRNTCAKFDADATGIISVFCSGNKAEGVNLDKLKYPLKNATLTSTVPLGISNEFLSSPSAVTVINGTLILIFDERNLRYYSRFKS